MPVDTRVTLAPLTGLPNWSFAVTVNMLAAPPAVIGLVPLIVDWAADTPAGFTTTDAVCVMATLLIVADTVFVSATVEATVPVVTPRPLVTAGCVTVLPVPVEARFTVAPLIRLPKPSLAVTVTVLPVPPALIGLVAVTVESEFDTPAGLTTTDAAVCVMGTPLMVVDTVFVSATVGRHSPSRHAEAVASRPAASTVLPVPVRRGSRSRR